jgi:outer membrane receptor protein involved in Fe transport
LPWKGEDRNKKHPGGAVRRGLLLLVGLPFLLALSAAAQTPDATVVGRVLDTSTGEPLAGALVRVEGTEIQALTDSTGAFRLERVPPGPQVLRADRLGYAAARTTLTVPSSGQVEQDIRMGVSALQTEGLIVTADPLGRARGELGTASVIDREAIRHQTAASLQGLLELVPGVPFQPPGLDGVQQISLRSVPTSGIGVEGLGPGGGDLASGGTIIILDGVPLSNNANLQSVGPRGEMTFQSSAGGGIDLRRMPATLIDRVEVIRGIPSARYGDLTQGVIVVDTRAGEVETELMLRRDERTTEVSSMTGHAFGNGQVATAFFDVTRTLLAPGARDDHSYRLAGQLAHRTAGGGRVGGEERLTFDTRLDLFQLIRDLPENPELQSGAASHTRDTGFRLSERVRFRLSPDSRVDLFATVDHQRQRAFRQGRRDRGALPFTDRLTEGRAEGRFIGGAYLSALHVDGDPWLVFTRLEATHRTEWLGLHHELRFGGELRREWNSGRGYQFDMETPPQVSFTGVQGFDRPRDFRQIPGVATSTLYLDDRFSRRLAGGMLLAIQAGLRVDVLHEGSNWLSSSRDAVIQPRLQAELAPRDWLRLRAGAGRTSKYPTLGSLYPAPQYHDMVNVNWYANDPDERLAVLTTFILDPTNPDLSQQVATKREVGVDVALGSRGGALSVVGFDDRIDEGIGLRRTLHAIPRDHYQLSDSTSGTGRPPELIEPAYDSDPVPVLLLEPANLLSMQTRGVEATLTLPEIRVLRTRFDVQGAWAHTRIESEGIEVGTLFSDFQLSRTQQRTPYWEGTTRTGERLMLNYRVIHQQPAVGLAITASVQHVPREWRRNIGAADSLGFAGYITREGEMVPVPETERGNEEYLDLQVPRRNILTEQQRVASDWLLSVQVSKTLPWEGRLSFYAFNLLDRVGQYSHPGWLPRLYPPMRFGLELTFPPGAFFR